MKKQKVCALLCVAAMTISSVTPAMAADSAVMVVDAAKGVEDQTRKLFHVCSLREMPIFTFINKMDREAQDPFQLLEDIESELGIKTYPMNWPIGSGKEFKGVYDRKNERIIAFNGGNHGATEVEAIEGSVDDERFREILGSALHDKLMEDIELLDIAGDEFDVEKVRTGELTPVFFGSALTNFGVEPFLEHFLKMTNRPLARTSKGEEVDPVENGFSAFVFKIQANMNKNHRDRIAFMRICSGKFEANMEVKHVQSKKKMRLSQPQQIMAQERKIVEEAYAGDIIGVFDPGIFSIGDTVCLPKDDFEYEGIPTFAPEHFARVIQLDSMKRKQFVKGVEQIAQEGAIQIFQEHEAGFAEIIVGVVGTLQFDVLKYRLENEYNCEIRLEPLPYQAIRWIKDRNTDMNKLRGVSEVKKVKDMRGNPLLLFKNEWGIQFVLDRNEGLELVEFSKE